MKRIKLLVATMLLSGLFTAGYGQQQQVQTQTENIGAPQAFKYQAIARNSNGEAIANQNVSFRISILESSASGVTVYQETQTATTNQFGLANLSIGSGVVVSGVFNTIQWGGNTYFVKIEFDPKGGSDYAYMGTSQMLSVPYSLYAEHAKTADNISSFPVKGALQGTNTQAPFDNPQTGMLVYNTDSAGSGIYSVVPGYYYNGGTPTAPNWILIPGMDKSLLKKRPMSSGSNITTYGGLIQDGTGGTNVASTVGTGGSGNDNTGFGTDALDNGMTGADNTAVGYTALNSLTSGADNTAVGSEAMPANTYASHNIAMGFESQYHQDFGSSSWNSYNVSIGDYTLYYTLSTSTSNGIQNTAIGYNVLGGNSTGVDNTGIGYYALKEASYSTGNDNTASGAFALNSMSTGNHNTADGDSALSSTTVGNNNTATGFQAIISNLSASYNTADGYQALFTQSYNPGSAWSSFNVAIGPKALYYNQPTSQTNGVANTAVGNVALYKNTTGFLNSGVGDSVLYNNTTGDSNSALGYGALYTNTTGTQNTAVGAGADVTANNLFNATAIGFETKVCTSNSMMFGNDKVMEWNFGVCPGATHGILNVNVGGGTTAYMDAGGAWHTVSDRTKKENFTQLDGEILLRKIDAMPITRWNYKTEAASMQHIGPMAQDFYNAFHLSNDSLTISTADEPGIALAGIQALNKKLEVENAALKLQLMQVAKSQLSDEEKITYLMKLVGSLTKTEASKK